MIDKVVQHIRTELGKVIVGQREPLDQLLLALLCGGHALVEGVPGIAKTLSVKALARLFQLRFTRVQCTSDLMPADVIGANVFNMASGAFSFHEGPLFTDLLLVDEVNRTPPRTQAALLEAMEERQATVDGVRYPLSRFFTTFATQNPVEFEGTYPLPEAQLDRFSVKVLMRYPDRAEEADVLRRAHEGFDPHDLDAKGLVPLDTEQLVAARQQVLSVTVEAALFQYVADIVRRTREWPAVSLGASPRAAVNLLLASKATAAMEGRDYLLPDDVKGASLPVLRHRLVLKPEADLEGLTPDQVVAAVLAATEVPK
jgi:MoxR-like ATPase